MLDRFVVSPPQSLRNFNGRDLARTERLLGDISSPTQTALGGEQAAAPTMADQNAANDSARSTEGQGENGSSRRIPDCGSVNIITTHTDVRPSEPESHFDRLSRAAITAARCFLAEECAQRNNSRRQRQSKLLRRNVAAAHRAGSIGASDSTPGNAELDAEKRRLRLAEWEAGMQEKQSGVREQLAEKKQLQEADRRRRAEEQAKKEEDAHRLKMVALVMKQKARRMRIREQEQRHKNRELARRKQIEDETVRRRELCERAVRQWRIQKDRQSRQEKICAVMERRREQQRGQELLQQVR